MAFMKAGRVWVASRLGISPIEPETSRANTIPTEFGCASLSRHSRWPTFSGRISSWQARCVKTSLVFTLLRWLVMATCASWL